MTHGRLTEKYKQSVFCEKMEHLPITLFESEERVRDYVVI